MPVQPSVPAGPYGCPEPLLRGSWPTATAL